MALSRTNLLGQMTTGNFGTGNFTSNSFTPASSSLLVVGAAFVENNGTTTDPTSAFTISGGSLTWTQQQTAVAAPTSIPSLVKIWTAPVATGSSMTITLSTSGRNAGLYGVSVVCYTGYDTSTPIGGTGNASQNGGFGSAPNPVSITLSAAPASGDEAFGFVFADKSTSDITPGSAFTEIDDLNNSNYGSMESEVRTGSTTQTVDWVDLRPGGGALFNFAAVAIVIRAAAGATATFPPTAQPRRRPSVPPRRPRTATPVRGQVNPPYPFTAVQQPRRLRGLLNRKPKTSAPVPPQVVVAAPAYAPLSVREKLRGLRLPRGRTATPAPGQAPAVAPGWRARVRGLRPVRGRLAFPVQSQDGPAAQTQRARLRLPRLFRGRTAAPVPPQIVVTPPAYPPLSVRSRVRGLRLFRGRAASPVPAQVVVTPPSWVPPAVRTRLKGLRLFRARPAAPPVDQLAPPVVPHLRGHAIAPRRGHAVAPMPPQSPPVPPATRARTKGLRPARGRLGAPVPPQVVLVPPPYPPTLTRARERLARIWRGASRFVPLVSSAPVVQPRTPTVTVDLARAVATADLSRTTATADLTRPSVQVSL